MVVHLSLSVLDSASTPSSSSFEKKSLNTLSLAVAKAKRVVVVTGAGISCSSGIPDFRSSDGLYALVKSRYPNIVLKGRDLFSASLFRDPESTRVFYSFIAELKRCIDAAKPAPTHHFIKTLDNKGKLLRSYTQNIDGFEGKVHIGTTGSVKGKEKNINIKEIKNVQLHGDIHRVRCTICSAESACLAEYLAAFREGAPPNCPECTERSNARVSRKARPLTIGTLRPNIVLYDEAHPMGEEIGILSTHDVARKPDMLIIMGTSLKVHGIKKLVKDFAGAVHSPSATNGKSSRGQNASQSSPPVASSSKRSSMHLLSAKSARIVVFVNRSAPPADLASIIDYWVEGDTDAWVAKCEADWRRSRPQDWEIQPTLFDSLREKGLGVPPLAEEINTFKIVKGATKSAKPKPRSKSTQGKSQPAISGSENALPVEVPLPPSAPLSPERIISGIPKSKLNNKGATSFMGPPRSTASTSSSSSSPSVIGSAIEPWLVPIPVSPKKRHPTGSQQTLVGDADDEDDEFLGSVNAIVVDELSALRPRKKRVVRAQYLDDEDEAAPIATGLLFGGRRGLDNMSLDDIDVMSPSSQSSQTTAVEGRASRSKTKARAAATTIGQKASTRDIVRSSQSLGTSRNPIRIE